MTDNDNIEEELNVIADDGIKAALNAAGIDSLYLANKLKTIMESIRVADQTKAVELCLKVRGDFKNAEVDDRPIRITFGPWATEGQSTDPAHATINKVTDDSPPADNIDPPIDCTEG